MSPDRLVESALEDLRACSTAQELHRRGWEYVSLLGRLLELMDLYPLTLVGRVVPGLTADAVAAWLLRARARVTGEIFELQNVFCAADEEAYRRSNE